MNLRTFAFIALASVSAFAPNAQARERRLHDDDRFMYAQPQNDASADRSTRAEAPRSHTLTCEQQIGNSANGS